MPLPRQKETDDQKKQRKDGNKLRLAVEKEMQGKIMDLLTPEQKAQLDAAKGKKSHAPAKPAATK